MNPFLKTKCIEALNPFDLSEKVNKFIKENEPYMYEVKEISWRHVQISGIIKFFAYVVYCG